MNLIADMTALRGAVYGLLCFALFVAVVWACFWWADPNRRN